MFIGAKRNEMVSSGVVVGITTDALIAFAYKYDCWNWTTTRAVCGIIIPATSETRCRYGDLCWSAKFGDLIGAACHGARKDRVVWIDIFAVRQWSAESKPVQQVNNIPRQWWYCCCCRDKIHGCNDKSSTTTPDTNTFTPFEPPSKLLTTIARS